MNIVYEAERKKVKGLSMHSKYSKLEMGIVHVYFVVRGASL